MPSGNCSGDACAIALARIGAQKGMWILARNGNFDVLQKNKSRSSQTVELDQGLTKG